MFAGFSYAAWAGYPKDCACGEVARYFTVVEGERISRCEACNVEAVKAKNVTDRNALMAEYDAAFKAVAAHNREALTCVFGTSADAEAWRKRATEVAARAHRAKAALERAGMMPR